MSNDVVLMDSQPIRISDKAYRYLLAQAEKLSRKENRRVSLKDTLDKILFEKEE